MSKTISPVAQLTALAIAFLSAEADYDAGARAAAPELKKMPQAKRDAWLREFVTGVLAKRYPTVAVADGDGKKNARTFSLVCEDEMKIKAARVAIAKLLAPLQDEGVKFTGDRAKGAGRPAADVDPIAQYLNTICNDERMSWDDVAELAKRLMEAAKANA
jgi:hypothetical protein